MSIFSRYNDTPNRIIKEGQEITLKFTVNGDGTATVSWNIPPSIDGCSVEEQSYDGILITVDTKPANYISTSPKNGEFYEADSSVDPMIHLGDKLDTALVVGAFYDDKTTTSLTIQDLNPKTNYYVSAYAVDNVRNYHREGVHAYSLPTGQYEKEEVDTAASQKVFVMNNPNFNTPVNIQDRTGLSPSESYTLKVKLNDTKDHEITLDGKNAQTYTTFLDEVNYRFRLLDDPLISPNPPNAGKYYLDLQNSTLQLWDGYEYNPEQLVILNEDPSTRPSGNYWFDSKNLYEYETGGWSNISFIKADSDPTKPVCGTLWYDGKDAYEYDGDHWVLLKTYTQSTNPLLAPTLTCNTYWFDTNSLQLFSWDADLKKWDECIAIVSATDPDMVATGTFWYDETDNIMKKYSAGSWNPVDNIRYEAANSNGTITNTIANWYWFDINSQKFYKRSSDNTTWNELEYILYPTDPTIRDSRDIWWEKTTSVSNLYAWDSINNNWIEITNFYESSTDPSLPVKLDNCVVWFDTTTNTIKYILRNTCSDKEYVYSDKNPINPPINTIWLNGIDHSFNRWDGSMWDKISVLEYNFDPYNLTTDYYWYNPNTQILSVWNGASWTEKTVSTTSVEPTNGLEWLNSTNNNLYTWDGSTWNVTNGLVYAQWGYANVNDQTFNGKAYIKFTTRDIGCGTKIDVTPHSKYVFTKIKQSVMYTDAIEGSDGMVSGPSYNQLGVGTDGSPDERRELHDTLRTLAGDPSIRMELTKEQIDTAIDLALMTLRKYSNYAYRRGFFFLDAKPNQQIYKMTDKCVGFNKIVTVNALYRMKAGFFRKGFANNDLFGFAALQQLYTIGTFDIVSFHLMSQYIETIEDIFASRIMFHFVERTRELKLMQMIYDYEKILVDGSIERTEQDLLTDRETRLWLTQWAQAEAKAMLSNVRGKYQSLPGPSGTTTLNGNELAAQAEAEKRDLMAQLLDDWTMQDINDIGMRAHFIIG